MPDAHDSSFGKAKRAKGIRSLCANPCWGTPSSGINLKVCNECKVNCLMKNLEDAARKSVRMYNEALEEAWCDEEAKAMVDGDNTIEFDTWEPDPKLLVYPPLLNKVIMIVEEYSSDCLVSPDMHEDEKYIDEDDLVDRMHEFLAMQQPLDPTELELLFKSEGGPIHPGYAAINTTPPVGMKIKYKNLKQHERLAGHNAHFGD